MSDGDVCNGEVEPSAPKVLLQAEVGGFPALVCRPKRRWDVEW
jgi:hypothetical protein